MKPSQIRDSILIVIILGLGTFLLLRGDKVAGGCTLAIGLLGFLLQGGQE
jgi:hypothetical protein